MPDYVRPRTHTQITADLVRQARRHVVPPAASAQPTGWVLFSIALPNILSNGTMTYTTTTPTIVEQSGIHDTLLITAGGDHSIEYGASGTPCTYLATELLYIEVSDAVGGDVFNLHTSTMPSLNYHDITAGMTGLIHTMILTSFGTSSGFGSANSSMTTLFEVEEATDELPGWAGFCSASAGRHLTAPVLALGVYRYDRL